MELWQQIVWMFVLALPIASIAWTITHEEVVREFRDYCIGESKTCRRIYERKFFYLFITRYKLLYTDWRGYLIAEFALVWVANVYMSLFGTVRLDLRKERAKITTEEALAKRVTKEPAA